jgi:hypothetical protein
VLEDWRVGRPRIMKDFKLRRINYPTEKGLVVDCSLAWDCLAKTASEVAANHTERKIQPSDLILGLFCQSVVGATLRHFMQPSTSSSRVDMPHFVRIRPTMLTNGEMSGKRKGLTKFLMFFTSMSLHHAEMTVYGGIFHSLHPPAYLTSTGLRRTMTRANRGVGHLFPKIGPLKSQSMYLI